MGVGLSGVLRYGVSTGINNLFNKNFPYDTLVVNVTGSFLMVFYLLLY